MSIHGVLSELLGIYSNSEQAEQTCPPLGAHILVREVENIQIMGRAGGAIFIWTAGNSLKGKVASEQRTGQVTE